MSGIEYYLDCSSYNSDEILERQEVLEKQGYYTGITRLDNDVKKMALWVSRFTKSVYADIPDILYELDEFIVKKILFRSKPISPVSLEIISNHLSMDSINSGVFKENFEKISKEIRSEYNKMMAKDE